MHFRQKILCFRHYKFYKIIGHLTCEHD